MVRPERLELPALWFEAIRSIQLSYGRMDYSVPPLVKILTAGSASGTYYDKSW